MRLAAIGLLAGAFVGVLGGLCGRLAMRVVAVAGGVSPVLTAEGTVLVLLIGLFHGVAGGVLFMALRPRLPGTGAGQGIAFGLVILLVFGPAFFTADQAGELGVSPLLGVASFSALFVLGGTLIGWAVPVVERRLPPGGRWTRALGVVGVLVTCGSAPSIVGAYVLAAMRLAALVVP